MRRREFARRIGQLADTFALTLRPNAIVQDLAVGERQRVEIVKCLMRRPRLLVLDEPTAVLLPDEIDALLRVCERVAASGCGVVLVTHKLAEIRRTAHRVTVLRLGRVVARSDRPAADLDHLVRAMIQRDLSGAGAAVQAAVGDAPFVDASTAPAHTGDSMGDVVLQIERLGLRDADGVRRLDGIDLSVRRGEIVGIAGVEGNGQSELVAVLSGMTPASEGAIRLAQHPLTHCAPRALTAVGVGVVPEDRHREGCVQAMSLAHNLALNQLPRYSGRFGLVDSKAMQRDARTQMQAFDIRAADPGAPFSSLSGGNQQKAVLARELGLPGLKLLIAAQPTRGLDVGAVESIYGHIRAAAKRGVAVLLASSELDELLAVADRILVMYRGRIMGECPARSESRAQIGAWMAGHA